MLDTSEKKSFFESLSFLDQSKEKKEEIAKIILDDSKGNKLYWIEIALSTLIATFGLLQNSVAVIIGAMLIAPLIRPMQAMSFAIATGRSSFFWRSTLFLLKSVAVSVIIAVIFSYFIPLKTETVEIIARTSPNILDLFIAIFSAIIALLALSYSRLSESVAGVAMAASLMPPLAVVGIEITLGNFTASWGSFLLFFINFLAILLVGVIVFVLYGFTPHQEMQKKISARKILTLVIIIIFTAIPLYSSLSNISEKIKIEKLSTELLTQIVPKKIPEGSLTGLKVKEVDNETIMLKGEIQVPENTPIFDSSYNSILSELEPHFEKKIDIDFTMIRIAKISSPDTTSIEKQKLSNKFEEKFARQFPSFKILQLSVIQNDKTDWTYKSIISIPPQEFLTDEAKEIFLSLLNEDQENTTHSIEWVTVAGSKTKPQEIPLGEDEILQKEISTKISEFFAQPEMQNIFIKSLQIDKNKTDDEDENINIIISLDYKTTIPKPIYLFGADEIDDQEFLSQESIEEKTNDFFKTLPYENISPSYRFYPYY